MNLRPLFLALLLALAATPVSGQVRVRDLLLQEQDVPRRLMGYGLVVGLDGSGDRTIGNLSGAQTVRSVANLLRRFDVEVPPELLRTRNVAAVLVTAEVSAYLRPGGRFEVQVASLGDATSLRGGMLWTTPLVADAGGAPVATAQGAMVMSDGQDSRSVYPVETSGRVPGGGLLEIESPVPGFATAGRLVLREPDLGTALRVAEAINGAVGEGTVAVLDPGALQLTLPEDGAPGVAALLGQIGDLEVTPDRSSRVIIDGRDGTVVAGGGMTVGEAVVSHRGITLTVVGGGVSTPETGLVAVEPGTSVQEVAAALQSVGAPPSAIAAIFHALKDVGAMTGEVTVR